MRESRSGRGRKGKKEPKQSGTKSKKEEQTSIPHHSRRKKQERQNRNKKSSRKQESESPFLSPPSSSSTYIQYRRYFSHSLSSLASFSFYADSLLFTYRYHNCYFSYYSNSLLFAAVVITYSRAPPPPLHCAAPSPPSPPSVQVTLSHPAGSCFFSDQKPRIEVTVSAPHNPPPFTYYPHPIIQAPGIDRLRPPRARNNFAI